MAVLSLLGVHTPFDPSHLLLRSCFRSVSPNVLTAYRVLAALYSLATLITAVVDRSVEGNGDTFFAYFTHLSFIGLNAYFTAAAVQGICYSLSSHSSKPYYPLQHWGKFLQFAHLLLYSTVVTYPILTTIVYWSLLAPSRFSTTTDAFASVAMHATNTVLVIIEFVLNAMPTLPWLHMPLCIIILGAYCGLAYVNEIRTGFYVYNFLNPSKGSILAAYIVGIGAAEAVIFVIIWALGWVKWRWIPLLKQYRHSQDSVYQGPEMRMRDDALEDGWVDVERPADV